MLGGALEETTKSECSNLTLVTMTPFSQMVRKSTIHNSMDLELSAVASELGNETFSLNLGTV